MIAASVLVAIAGFAALCLGMARHQRDVVGKPLSRRSTWLAKAAGWLALAMSFVLAIVGEGAALGAIYGVGILTLAALIVALCTTALSRRR